MKAFFLIAATSILMLASQSYARGNGVERGEISVNADSGIPPGVEDRIETTMFGNCDLRGATQIKTTYVQLGQTEWSNSYDIQYTVEFPGRSVVIYVRAILYADYLDARPESALKIEAFDSVICRKIP